MNYAPNGLRVSLSFVLVICLTSTASSRTRFMNSSKPLILPSMRMESCSYNQTLTEVFCDC